MLQYPLLGPRDPESMGCRRVAKGLSLIVLGAAMLIWFPILQHRRTVLRDLPQKGTRVEGWVQSAVLDRGLDERVRLGYSFTAGDRTVEAQNRLGIFSAGVKRGDRIVIWYDPSNSERCVTQAELDASGTGGSLILGMLLGAAMVLMGGLTVVWTMRGNRRTVLSD